MKRVAYLALVSLMLMVLLVPVVSTQETRGPKIDILRHTVIRSPDAQLQAMQDGEVDVLTQRTRPTDIDSLSENCYTITSTHGFHICFISFNVRPDQSYRRPEINYWPLADVNFTHALAHSVNKLEILAGNWVKTPLDSMVPPIYGGWRSPEVDPHPFNLGDPLANTVYPDDHSTCGILRYGGYHFVDADNNGIVTTPDYWTMPNGEPLPQMEVFSPTCEVDPQKAWVVFRWLADCSSIGLVSTDQNGHSGLTQSPREFSPYITDVYEYADFDAYIVNFKLNRFPDYLYDWFHSSQDSLSFLGAYNAFGVNDPTLDGLLETLKFSLDHQEKLQACYDAQEWLADPNNIHGVPVLPVYTMDYYDAFNPDLKGIVKSPGFGAGDGGCVALKEPNGPSPFWTYLNIHWELGVEPSALNWCLSDEPERLNPLHAGTTSAWEIMDRVFDPLIMVNPYTHEDIPWIAESWEITQTPTGMDVTFHLRNDVYWQDGNLYTAYDAEFSLEFLRDNQIYKYKSAWEHIVDVEVINDYAFTVHSDATSQFLIYDWAVLAALLPPPVWADWNGRPLIEILARDLSMEPGWNGQTPTNLFGTGPFVFDYYDPVGMAGELHANRLYFKTTAEIQDQLAEMRHRVGNVNYPGSYYESVYNAKGIGVDDYITIVDIALIGRAYHTWSFEQWGVGWGLYNPDADINGDGVVDTRDMATANFFWGLNYHYSPFPPGPSGRPKVKVVAPTAAIKVGEQFTVDIVIKHVEGLNTYEFTLSWNPNLLRMISVVGGGFISEEGVELATITDTDYTYVGDLLGPTTQSGSGTLATITFECLGKGKVTLDLSSRLFDITLNSMPHKDIDGVVRQRP